MKSSPRSREPEKARMQKQRPNAAKKKKERQRECSRLKEAKEMWQLNVIHGPGLDPELGRKQLKRTLMGQLTKFEYGLSIR